MARSAYTPSVQTGESDAPMYICRADISASLAAYERLLNASKAYTTAMSAMSTASANLAAALQDCSVLKGAHACGTALQAACGLHYLKSNYEQVLCDTFWKEFSIPLLSHLDVYRHTVQDRQMAHELAMAEHSRALQEIEKSYQRQGVHKDRDLNSYRAMLHELQERVNEMDHTKAQHYMDALQTEEQTWDLVAQNVMLLVRAQVDMADRLSSKAVNDPVLESLMANIPDPFQTYGPLRRENELFSILEPTHGSASRSATRRKSAACLAPPRQSGSGQDAGSERAAQREANEPDEAGASGEASAVGTASAASAASAASTAQAAQAARTELGARRGAHAASPGLFAELDGDVPAVSDDLSPATALPRRPSLHHLFGYATEST